jgi:hypothetical protein
MDTEASEHNAALSPDGRWLAYGSDEMTNNQVFVRAFPGPGGKWQVSSDGGGLPRWSPDGRLFYRWRTGLYSVTIETGTGNFSASRPELVFDDLATHTAMYAYDVYDSNRILLIEDVGSDSEPIGVTVVVDWLGELERKLPN